MNRGRKQYKNEVKKIGNSQILWGHAGQGQELGFYFN